MARNSIAAVEIGVKIVCHKVAYQGKFEGGGAPSNQASSPSPLKEVEIKRVRLINKLYIIFLGAPGAGKGTQAARVAQELKLVHVATGDLFRQALEQGTKLAIQAKSYMEKGMLVPDELTIRRVLEGR